MNDTNKLIFLTHNKTHHNTRNKTLNNRIIMLLVSTALLFTNNLAFAKNNLTNVGPELGSIAPEINVINIQEKSVNIEQLSGKNGLILLFFRSADWCPFCKRHLIEMNEYTQKLTGLGYGLAAISYDNTTILKAFTEQHNIEYPLLSDQQVNTMKAYGIVNQQYKEGDDNYGIPYPGVVVIDQKGKVVHKYFFEGYKNRVKLDDLYQQLAH